MPDYNPGRDLAAVTSMAADLEPYLLSDELYWPIGGPPLPGGGRYPRLTFGGLFLALRRLSAVEPVLPPEQTLRLRQSQELLETARSRWGAAMDRKLEREIKSRLDLWSAFLKECSENRSACADNYPQQVEYRTMLELLFGEVSRPPADSSHRERLAGTDRQLRARFAKGAFVWDPGLQTAFPPDRFWFLYGSVLP